MALMSFWLSVSDEMISHDRRPCRGKATFHPSLSQFLPFFWLPSSHLPPAQLEANSYSLPTNKKQIEHVYVDHFSIPSSPPADCGSSDGIFRPSSLFWHFFIKIWAAISRLLSVWQFTASLGCIYHLFFLFFFANATGSTHKSIWWTQPSWTIYSQVVQSFWLSAIVKWLLICWGNFRVPNVGKMKWLWETENIHQHKIVLQILHSIHVHVSVCKYHRLDIYCTSRDFICELSSHLVISFSFTMLQTVCNVICATNTYFSWRENLGLLDVNFT